MADIGQEVQAEARRQERAIAALVAAGMMPGDAERAVRAAAAAEQRLPSDIEIADDVAFVGTDADIENSRQWWYWTLARLAAWRKSTRMLDATKLQTQG